MTRWAYHLLPAHPEIVLEAFLICFTDALNGQHQAP